jgi:hypothetical protein
MVHIHSDLRTRFNFNFKIIQSIIIAFTKKMLQKNAFFFRMFDIFTTVDDVLTHSRRLFRIYPILPKN